MPIITNPTPTMQTPPSTYRICGVSMHNVAVPTRQEINPDTQEPETVVSGYMIVEWEAGDGTNGDFVRRATGTVRLDGDAFLAYMLDPTGAAIAALLKLYLHQAMVEAGVFPAGQNAMTADEMQKISSFCGRWLANS